MTNPLNAPGIHVALPVLTALVGLLSSMDASGVEPPPARSHLQTVSEIAQQPVSSEGLGIRLTRATAVLRQQLALKRGAGLVVDQVASDSPAATAGFVQHDVLVRLDNQLLVLPEQFDALLEAAEPEDPLACTVLRGGREVAITLAATSGRVATEVARSPVRPATRPLRPAASALAIVRPVPQQVAHRPDQVTSHLQRLTDETLLRQDADYEIRLSRGDQTRLVVSDTSGQVVFTGAIDEPAARDRVPVAVRTRVAEMERLLEPRSAPPRQTAGPATRPVAEIGRLDITPVELR
jgi:hypothetical protein